MSEGCMFIRCKGCGEMAYIGRKYGVNWTFRGDDKNIDDFLDKHSLCEYLNPQNIGVFELVVDENSGNSEPYMPLGYEQSEKDKEWLHSKGYLTDRELCSIDRKVFEEINKVKKCMREKDES